MKICPDYTGVSCIDGTCPVANAAEYAERCMDVTRNCNECIHYHGCDDCAWLNTDFCDHDKSLYK